MVKLTSGEIIAALPGLGQAKLATVRAACDHLLKKPAPAAPASPLYGLIIEALGVKLPYTAFRNTKAFKNWPEQEAGFLSWLKETWPDATGAQEAALAKMMIVQIINDLKLRKIPATVSTVVANLPYVGVVFEKSFPGYKGSSLASLVLEAMVRK